LQFLCCVGGFAIDVHACAEFLRQSRVFDAAPYSRHLLTEFARELNSKVPQAADALCSNKIAGGRTTVPQRVEGGDSGAQRGCCFGDRLFKDSFEPLACNGVSTTPGATALKRMPSFAHSIARLRVIASRPNATIDKKNIRLYRRPSYKTAPASTAIRITQQSAFAFR
jgi:hypothetical protein